jgi:hypothetical protein
VVQSELRDIERLSRLLRVPEDVAQPDPFFVARFRARRDALRAASHSARPWRQLAAGLGSAGDASLWRRAALRLLPLAASALLAAVIAVWVSGERTNALGELEMTELGEGVADVTLETPMVEPVLRIALGEL